MNPDHTVDRALRPARACGFTLLEVLAVVVILGVFAAMVVPQLTSAASETREGSAKMNLHRLRTQLELYAQQHNGAYPQLEDFEAQMTLSSDADGLTAPLGTSGYPLGPYIREVPANPQTGTADISDGAVGTSAWYYDQATGGFRANDSAESREF